MPRNPFFFCGYKIKRFNKRERVNLVINLMTIKKDELRERDAINLCTELE